MNLDKRNEVKQEFQMMTIEELRQNVFTGLSFDSNTGVWNFRLFDGYVWDESNAKHLQNIKYNQISWTVMHEK